MEPGRPGHGLFPGKEAEIRRPVLPVLLFLVWPGPGLDRGAEDRQSVLLWTGTLKDVMPDVEAAVAFAEKASWEPIEDDKIHSWIKNDSDKGKLWKDYMQHEGVVVRTVDYDKDNNIGVSFKIKNIGYQERGLGKIHQDCVDYKNNHGVNYDR